MRGSFCGTERVLAYLCKHRRFADAFLRVDAIANASPAATPKRPRAIGATARATYLASLTSTCARVILERSRVASTRAAAFGSWVNVGAKASAGTGECSGVALGPAPAGFGVGVTGVSGAWEARSAMAS